MGALKLMPDIGNTVSMNEFRSSIGQSSNIIIYAQNSWKVMWTGRYTGFLSVTSVCKKLDTNELHLEVIYRTIFKYTTLNARNSLR